MAKQNGIAAGVKVVEIGSSLSVALAGMTLADAGAEVIGVEKPGGSPLRDEPAFAMWGRGKRSVTLDLATTSGREKALALIASADVAILGMKPASIDRLGLDYASLTPHAPGLVVASLTGFGLDGPYRDVPVYDGVIQARGGRMYDFSPLHEGERPAFAAAPVPTYGAAMALLSGIFGALRERELNGGAGQLVETSMARALAVYDLVGWIPGGPPPMRTEDVPFLPYSVARTRDGVWIQFAQNGPALFGDFLRVLGLDGEINYLDAMTPVADSSIKRGHRDRVQAKIAEKTWAEWQELFADERNLSAEPFHPPGGALDHAQFKAIGDVVEVADATGRLTTQLGPIFDVPERPLVPAGPAPLLNQGPAAFESTSASPPRPEGQEEPGPGLLSGVTILELGMWIALPYAATQLAELGARVIKLEPIEGDPMRTTGPVGYKIVQGKESIALDLKKPEATEIVHRLAAKADAVLHSYRPGVPERLGIDFATLKKINPKLVYLYNGSYGSRGPKSYAPAFHVTGGAVAGGAWAQAGVGCPPAADVVLSDEERARVSRRLELSNEANPDFNSAVTAAAATAMALYHQTKTGEGLEVETRMMQSNAMMMSPDFIDFEDRPARRQVDADLNGYGPLYQLYRAAEGWVFIAAPQQPDFERLCEALAISEVAADTRFSTVDARAAHSDALASALGAAIGKRAADELEQNLTSRGVACMRADYGPYRTWLFDQDWALDQGVVADVEESMGGPYRRYGAALVNDRPVELKGATPSGGETRALLEEIGYKRDEIDRLLAEGVVSSAGEE